MQKVKKNNLGFTLVELLIVVTIIGILAVAVLAAINPIEQFNKTRDTGHKTDAGQIVNAIERYYTNNDMYPWNTAKVDAEGSAYYVLNGINGDGDPLDDEDNGIFQKLVDQGELKQSFVDKYVAKDLSKFEFMYIVKEENSNEINVCFQPQSKAMRTTEAIVYSGDITDEGLPGVAESSEPFVAGETDCDEDVCIVCMPEIVK